MRMLHRAWMSLAIVLACSAWAGAQPPTPKVIDLETLGNNYSEASATNERGQVVGRSGGQAFLWTLQEGMTRLGDLDPWGSAATLINDRGEVAGTSRLRAFYWSRETGVVDIGTLGGDAANPADLNNLGHIVGDSTFEPGSFTTRAFFWSRDIGMIDLGTLPGGRFSGAYRINDAGDVLGWSETLNGKVLPVLWTRTSGMHRFLPPLPAAPQIAGLNERGEVAGQVSGHAFQWSPSSGFVDLGTLGGPYSWGYAINDHGQVAGLSTTSEDRSYRAFLWTPGEGMTDLGSLGRYISVRDLNNEGEVTGFSAPAAHPELSDVAFLASVRHGMLPLYPIAGRQSAGNDINDRGHIVGFSTVVQDAVDRHAALWLIRTPIEQIDALAADLEELVAGGHLAAGFGEGLSSTLGAARGRVLAGRTARACDLIRLFIAQVDSLAVNGFLAGHSARLLREQADWTLFGLGCQ